MKWRRVALLVLTGLIAAAPVAAEPRDGSHDFDGELGRWTIRTRRLMTPLAGASDWVTYEGSKIVTPIWGGRANLAEVDEQGAAGRLRFAALRLYDPASRQWSLHFTSAGAGVFGTPAFYGERRAGGVEFVGPDVFHGRAILVRFRMIDGDADHAGFEQAFSADGGRTWEVNWINEYTRVQRLSR